MARRGRRANPVRDVWVYLTVQKARRKGLLGMRGYEAAQQTLAHRLGVHLSPEAVRSACNRGRFLWRHRPWPLTPRKMRRRPGRPVQPDVVRDVIIYDLITEELKKHPSRRRAYGLVAQSEYAMSLTPGAIRAVYHRVSKKLA